MDQKPRLFIYDRKEMVVLILLGVMVSVFAFTLGVHLGKRVGPKPVAQQGAAPPVQTLPDRVPERGEIGEASRGAIQNADEALTRGLHNEVARTGIKIDKVRQVDLPSGTRSKNAGATTLKPKITEVAVPRQGVESKSEVSDEISPKNTMAKFSLQVGSHQAMQEAKLQISELESKGLKPFLRPADIHGKGKWYRVYVGGYETKHAAEQAGVKFRGDHLIDSYVIAKIAEQ